MTRLPIAVLTLLLLAGMLAWDLASSQPLNPFKAPSLIAFGSGEPASGAHCAALPARD